MSTPRPHYCPFCHGRRIETLKMKDYMGIKPDKAEITRHWAYCRGCSASGPYAPSPQEAIKRWNDR